MRILPQFYVVTLLPFLLLLPACGTLIGVQKPVAQKASDFHVIDLSVQPGGDWTRLPSAQTDEDNDISDLSYQSKSMAGIISLNSACRRRNANGEQTLKESAQQLFLGIYEAVPHSERELKIDGQKAYETTVEGTLNNAGKREPVKLRAVVLRKGECFYDLMYVARPDRFELKESDFSKFIDSLRLD